jgi:hypothetical protein
MAAALCMKDTPEERHAFVSESVRGFPPSRGKFESLWMPTPPRLTLSGTPASFMKSTMEGASDEKASKRSGILRRRPVR